MAIIKKGTIKFALKTVSLFGLVLLFSAKMLGFYDANVIDTKTRVKEAFKTMPAHADAPGGGGGGGGGGGNEGGQAGEGGGSSGGSSGGGMGNGCSGSTGCFVAGTKVTMADGTEKVIEKVKEGDAVLAWDFSKNAPVEAEVVEIWSGHKDNLYKINDTEVTDIHPFWVIGKGWAAVAPASSSEKHGIDVAEFAVGDEMMKLDGSAEKVNAIEKKESDGETVYNLAKIETYHNFFANGVLVHNKVI